MPTVTYNGDSFSCTKAVKGADYIDLYSNDVLIVKFGGVVDFSKFTISGGSWSAPAGVEEVRGTATLANGLLTVTVDEEVGDNTVVKFCAPCACSSVTTGVKIGDTTYTVVDASGNVMTGAGSGAWAANAHVALLLSKSTSKAYIQNSAVSDAYTKEQSLSASMRAKLGFDSTATPSHALAKLFDEGPHKIGDIKSTILTNVGDEWVLCNGDYFKPEEYPEYATICPDMLSLFNLSRMLNKLSTSTGTRIGKITEANGYQVALLYMYDSSAEDYYMRLVYSKDWFETIAYYRPYDDKGEHVFQADYATLERTIIRYIDGVWIIAYAPSSNYPGALRTYYTTDITKWSSWKRCCYNVNYGTCGIANIFDMWKDTTGQILIAASGDTDNDCSNRFAFIITLASYSATTASVTQVSAVNFTPGSFTRDGGYLAFFGYRSNPGSPFLVYSRGMAYAWNEVAFTYVASGATFNDTYSVAETIRYVDGAWVGCSYVTTSTTDGSTTTTYYHPAIVYTRDLSATSWTVMATDKIKATNDRGARLYDFVLGRDRFVGLGYYHWYWYNSFFIMMENLFDASTWELIKFSELGATSDTMYESDMTGRTSFSTRAVNAGESIVVPTTYGAIIKHPLYAVPAITNPNYHTYIKVKG